MKATCYRVGVNLSILGVVLLVLDCSNTTSPEAQAVGGLYLLTQVDGMALPAPPSAPGSAVPCPSAITDGELALNPVGSRNFQEYTITAYQTRACDPDGMPVDATTVLSDAGDWSISGRQIGFVSSPSNNKGKYAGSVQSSDPVPIVAVVFAGHTYAYRRLADQSRQSSGVIVLVVDQQGSRVGGALVVFHASNGQVLRTFSGTSDPQVSAPASAGIETINVAPPGGYTFAPGQRNPVTLTLAANAVDTTTVALAKTAPVP